MTDVLILGGTGWLSGRVARAWADAGVDDLTGFLVERGDAPKNSRSWPNSPPESGHRGPP